MVMSKGITVFLDENKIKELIKEVNDRIDLFHEYFDINYEEGIISIPYSCDIKELKVLDGVSLENGFESDVREESGSYLFGSSLYFNNDGLYFYSFHDDVDEGTHHSCSLWYNNLGELRFDSTNPNAKITYNNSEVLLEGDLDYLEKKLKNLQASAEGSIFVYQEDNNIAYEKLVPQNSNLYAVVNKVGGMSYVSENLVLLDDMPETILMNGLTAKIENGVITLNGTAKTNQNCRLTLKNSINTRDYYAWGVFNEKIESKLLCGFRTADGQYPTRKYLEVVNQTSSFTPYEGLIVDFFVHVDPNDDGTYPTLNNFEIKPMLIKGKEVPTKYKKGGVIFSSPVAEINSNSANLIYADDVEETTTSYGLTYSFKNGILTINGTSTATDPTKILIKLKEQIPIGTYALKNFVDKDVAVSKDSLAIVPSNQWETVIGFAPANITFTTKQTTQIGMYFMYYMPVGQTYNNYKVIPMLVKGSVEPTEFKPYKQPINKPLPNAVLTLTDYGLGINEEYNNYIDFENKKYIRMCAPFIANGNNNIGIYSKNEDLGFYKFQIEITKNETLKASKSTNTNLIQNSTIPNYTKYADYANNTYEQMGLQNYFIYVVISKDKASTVEEMKTWLQNNPISGVYALETPIEEDISYLLKDVDEFIEVEELGSIRFENEYEQDVPSTITYQVKI